MEDLMALPVALPQAPGTGPFHIRGLIYTRTLADAKRAPGGLDAVLAQLSDVRMRAFLGGPFSFMSWHDAVPLVFLQMAIARAEERAFEELVRERAKEAVHTLIPGIFRGIVGLGRPRAAAQHLPRMARTYLDFGVLTLERTEDGFAQALATRVPQLLAASTFNALLGATEGFLEAMGVHDIRSRIFDVQRDGSVEGYPAVKLRMVHEWR